MPYKFETQKKKIPKKLDKRVKLTDEEREEIKKLYGKVSQRKLAEMFGVSRRLIVFIGDEKKYKRNKEIRKGMYKQYYNKKRHREYMRRYRRHKKELNDKGLLK